MKSLGLNPNTILPTPPRVDAIVLVAGTGQAIDTPTGAAFVGFGSTMTFYVAYGSTGAAVPSTNNVAGTASEQNPSLRNIGSTLTTSGLSIVSTESGPVVLSWYGP